jgi:hypothetical protein
MIFAEDFLGNDRNNETETFTGGDAYETFVENAKKMPSDWIYHTEYISYTYNSYGHRCENLKDIDTNNYILFTGCSHTEGVGLKLEKTYPYMTAKQLGCDYYNLSIAGTGFDVLEYNLLTWFHKVKQKPKYVVIQWPDHSRYVSLYPGYHDLMQSGRWMEDENTHRFMAASEELGIVHARKQISRNLLKNIIGDVPLIEINFQQHSGYSNDCLWLKRIDFARDLQHAGIKSHENATKSLVEHITEGLESDKYMHERLSNPA